MSRRVFAIIEVDDDKAIAEDKGTGEYLEKEIERLKQNGIDLEHWLIAVICHLNRANYNLLYKDGVS